MVNPILQAEKVSRVVPGPTGPIPILKGVDLTVQPGQFIAIMGRSGSGKSTLLHILGGLDLPSSGRVLIDGVDTTTLSDAQRATLRRERTSFIFQFFNLIPYLNAEDNIMLPNLLGGGQRGRDYRARLPEILTEMELQGCAKSYPDQLAGGEQQRVAIARALLLRPALILADEPTGNLDYHTGTDILRLLWRTVYEWGRTVVLVTHDARSAAYAEHVYIMRDGAWAGQVPLRQADPAGWEKHDPRALVPVLQQLGL